MTGGCALILGEVGPNFAAGMTGGIAYVYDEYRTLAGRCNLDTVALREPSPAELAQIRELIVAHVRATQSPLGIKMLYRFDAIAAHFVKVVPVEYERVMAIVEDAKRAGATREEALETAFEVVTGAKEVKRHG